MIRRTVQRVTTRWPWCVAMSMCVVLGAAAWTHAQDRSDVDSTDMMLSTEQEQRAARISDAVLSPFCPGQTLSSCPSPNAKAWRDDIKQWVAQGVPSAEIASRLQARVPEKNLSGMPPDAWNWALPLFGVLLASIVLIVFLFRLRLKNDTQASTSKDPEGSGSMDQPTGATNDSRAKDGRARDAQLDEELARLS